MPWRLIDGPEAADAVADEIARAPYRRASRTSISGALLFAKPLFDTSGYRGLRRVIDVSGDGANNAGAPVVPTRDEVLAAGITINGLPIMLKRPSAGMMDIENLDVYYEDCVIGGPGAFVVPIQRARAIHRGDAHQIDARDRRPPAGGARHAGCGPGAAHLLPDRREAVAGPLGRARLRFPVERRVRRASSFRSAVGNAHSPDFLAAFGSRPLPASGER